LKDNSYEQENVSSKSDAVTLARLHVSKRLLVFASLFFFVFTLGWIASLYTTEKKILDPSNYFAVEQDDEPGNRIQQFITYIETMRTEENVIIITAHDDASASFSTELEEYFNSIGLYHSLIGRFRYAYIAIIDSGVAIFENYDEEFSSHITGIGQGQQTHLSVASAGLSEIFKGGRTSVLINDREYSLSQRGLNVVVYNNRLGGVVDSVSIDTHHGLAMIRASYMMVFDDGLVELATRRLWFGFGQITLLFIGIAILFYIFFNRQRDRLTEGLFKKEKLSVCLGSVGAVLLPNIFLFYLYNLNHLRNDLIFSHSIFLMSLFAFISVLIFLLLIVFVKCKYSAMITLILLWTIFWFFGSLYGHITNYSTVVSPEVFLWVLLFCVMLLVLLLRLFNPFVSLGKPAFNMACLAIFALFIFNFAPAVNHEILVRRNSGTFHMNRNFLIDAQLPKPDIYWIHFDNAAHHLLMYELFDINPAFILNELEDRGFLVYENELYLNAGSTGMALPALFSPDFYDYIFGELMNRHRDLTDGPRAAAIATELVQQEFILDYTELFQFLELHHALRANDYTLITLGVPTNYAIWSPFDVFYDIGIRRGRVARYSAQNETFLQSFINSNTRLLLARATPLSLLFEDELRISNLEWNFFSDHEHPISNYDSDMEMRLYNALIDSRSILSPRFVHIYNDFAHHVRWGLIDEMTRPGADNLERWLIAYRYALDVTIRMLDLIIANNPDAVIVIQSDHGLRGAGNWLLPEDVIRLQDSVFSAVRIPDAYGGLDAPVHPLNIARELVNRFVGQNYTLLP